MSDSHGHSGRKAAFLFAIMLLAIAAVMQIVSLGGPPGPSEAQIEARERTGGAQTLEDILRRQRGEPVSDDFRRAQSGSQAEMDAIRGQLGTLGGASDADVFRKLRFGTADVKVSTNKPVDRVLVQDGGMTWLAWREGPLAHWGGWLLIGTLVLLAIFYLIRGPIMIDKGRSGIRIPRFDGFERFAHWLLATSFILLALTGLFLLFGRPTLISLIGRETYAALAGPGKWVHNSVAWAFMLALVLVFVQWVLQNIPNRHDLDWLAMAGGFFGGGHPHSRKFNAGQKLVFWSVVVLGASVSISGLSLLFPFQMPLFAKTFEAINHVGGLIGLAPGLPEHLQPQEEMQFSQLWHAIVAFAMMAIILAHIYIGTIGMEGGFEAMGSGEVDLNWAEEHHDLWVEEMARKGRLPDEASHGAATPAE